MYMTLKKKNLALHEMAGDPVAEKAAASVLTRAVELDGSKRFTEALVCYQEGLALLMEAVKAKGIHLMKFMCVFIAFTYSTSLL